LLPFNNKKYFTLESLSTHITLKITVGILLFFFFYFFFIQKRGYISPKIGEKKISKSVSGYFKTKNKKILLPLSSGGGGEGLNGTAIKKRTFFDAS